MKLAIEKHLPEIQQILQNTNRLVLQSPPGSGKSTLVPKHLSTHFPKMKIVISQAKRSAVIALALYLNCSYFIRNERRICKQSNITICTEGVLQHIYSEFDLVIIDEAHELTDDVIIVLAKLVRGDQKILVMSATMNENAFQRYLGCGVVRVEEEGQYGCEVVYSRQIDDYVLNYLDGICQLIEKAVKIGPTLVFLPGINDINWVFNQFRELRPVKIYSKSSQDDISLALDGNTMLILATDSAETSITFPQIKCVVDSGIVKKKEFIEEFNIYGLKTQLINQFSQIQRQGRVGRVQNGTYFCNFSEVEMKEIKQTKKQISFNYLKFVVEIYNNAHLKFIAPPKNQHLANVIQQLFLYKMIDNQYKMIDERLPQLLIFDTIERTKLFLEAEKQNYKFDNITVGQAVLIMILFIQQNQEYNYSKEETNHGDFILSMELGIQQFKKQTNLQKDVNKIMKISKQKTQQCLDTPKEEFYNIIKQLISLVYANNIAVFDLNWRNKDNQLVYLNQKSSTISQQIMYESVYIVENKCYLTVCQDLDN